MSSNIKTKIAPTQSDYESVSGIDALYFYIKVDFDDYTKFYHNHLLKNHIISENMEILSKNYDNQFTYFSYSADIGNESICEGVDPKQKICRIGFKNLNQLDNLHSVIVEMDSIALQQMTIENIITHFTDLLNSYGLVPLKFQTRRVDLNTYVFNYSLDWINYNYFSTRSRKTRTISNTRNLETFELGSRGGIFLRIYNKLLELSKKDIEIERAKKYLIYRKYIRKYLKTPEVTSLWNIEFELHREQLRTYKIDTLDDLNDKMNSLHSFICKNSFRLLKKEKKLDTNDSKIENHSLWNHISESYDYNGSVISDIEKAKLKQYLRDNTWLKNRLEEYLSEPRNTDNDLKREVNHLLSRLS